MPLDIPKIVDHDLSLEFVFEIHITFAGSN